MTAPGRPLLRYHGGKWMLAPWVLAHLPPHRLYVEPYGGAASVLLRKPRSYSEVYNDIDGEVVNLFRVVAERGNDMTRALLWTPYSRDEYLSSFEPADDPLERARRLLVRSFMGFGSNSIQVRIRSGFRANANRFRTTPAHDWANFPPTIRAVARRLRGVVIENRPALDIIRQHDSPSTLLYCDPPYVHETRSDPAHHGYNHEMGDDDHREMAAALRSVKGMVVVSGYPSPLYDEDLFRDWWRVEREALADGARKRTEVLWLNPAAEAALHDASAPLLRGEAQP